MASTLTFYLSTQSEQNLKVRVHLLFVMKLYYDDSCSFCTQWAKKQGIPTQPLRSKKEYASLETMVLETNGKRYYRSDAAIRIISMRGGVYKLIKIGWLVPRPLRDFIYDCIGRIRHKLL